MNTQQDFKELLQLLEKHDVEYMIVGGYAVAFHGFPRFTNDLDIFFHPSAENVARVIDALVEFGFSTSELRPDIFMAEGNIVTFGVAPVRVDFINSIDQVEFAAASRGKVRGKYGDTDVSFIGKEDLLVNKRATGRTKDKADIEELS